MNGFSAEWLALREPLDALSRSAALVARLRANLPSGELRIIDLAAGSGANLRYLAPRLGGEQDWLLVDNDEALLEAAGARLRAWQTELGMTLHQRGETLTLGGRGLRCRIRRLRVDLVDEAHRLNLNDHWLVTASALLDLVSQQWLDDLLAHCRSAGARVLFALTYDGMANFSPVLAEDEIVNALVNQHQTRDKGFGSALGPRAAWHAPDASRRHGYATAEASTPWRIGPAHVALHSALVEGWAQAAVEIAPDQTDRIQSWVHQRQTHIAAGSSRLHVGHRDMLACPVPDENG